MSSLHWHRLSPSYSPPNSYLPPPPLLSIINDFPESAIGDGQQGTEINIVERPLTDSATAYSRPRLMGRGDHPINLDPLEPFAFLVTSRSKSKAPTKLASRE